MVNIRIENRHAVNWRTYSIDQTKIWIRGTVFFDDKFYREDVLADPVAQIAQLMDVASVDNLASLRNKLNGFFAIVIQKNNSLFAAVDQVRSIPIFYGQINEQIFLSDDAEWVRQNVGDTQIDPQARQEFLLTGYVTGQKTLLPHVKQLQAGELLRSMQSKNGAQIQRHRYYSYRHTLPEMPVDEDKLLNELAEVAEKSVQRLIDYANGRQIVIPLSAGYDSRLIITLLRKLNYENVLSYSYGARGNYESRVSNAVAKSLNYSWEFIKYSNVLWRQWWWKSKERLACQWWASNWSSLFLIQEWPAVKHLKESNKIESNAVFAPGYSGDLLAGSRSLYVPYIYENNILDLRQVTDAIIYFHYSLYPIEQIEEEIILLVRKKVLEYFELSDGHTNNASAFEAWDITERQAKFINNAVRVYEFWEYDWYLPLWDWNFMQFWQKVPMHLRWQKRLYDQMVSQLYNSLCVQLGNMPVAHQIKGDYTRAPSLSMLHNLINDIPGGKYMLSGYRWIKYLYTAYTHPMRWHGIQSLKFNINERGNINSILVRLYLSEANEYLNNAANKRRRLNQ